MGYGLITTYNDTCVSFRRYNTFVTRHDAYNSTQRNTHVNIRNTYVNRSMYSVHSVYRYTHRYIHLYI